MSDIIKSTITEYQPMKFDCSLRCADLSLEQIHAYAEEDIADGKLLKHKNMISVVFDNF